MAPSTTVQTGGWGEGEGGIDYGIPSRLHRVTCDAFYPARFLPFLSPVRCLRLGWGRGRLGGSLSACFGVSRAAHFSRRHRIAHSTTAALQPVQFEVGAAKGRRSAGLRKLVAIASVTFRK